MSTYNEASRSFHTLLHWHLAEGTRPLAHKDRGIPWGNEEFAAAVCRQIVGRDLNERTVRGWRKGSYIPRINLLDHILRALFGDEPSGQQSIWRDDLQAAYDAAKRNARNRSSQTLSDDSKLTASSDIETLRSLAEKGDPKAQYDLGLLHLDGLGVRLDPETALQWIVAAAHQGYIAAQIKAGCLYCFSNDIPEDDDRAFYWLNTAAAQGDATAQYYLAEFHSSHDYDEARRWYLRAAQQGHREAALEIAWEYSTGRRGAIRDYKEALRWYHVAADQGDSVAQRCIAEMYKEGQGVQQDYVEALRWYELSARNGDTVAEFEIGYFYKNGLGVEKDYDKAIKCFWQAANGDQIEAEVELGLMYRDGIV